MKRNITPETALAFTKLSVLLATVWPPDPHIDGLKIKIANVVWCSSILSAACLFFPLLVSVKTYKDDPVIMSKSICLCCAGGQVIMKSVVCRIHRKKLQFMLSDLNEFLKSAKSHERMLIQKCIDKYTTFHVTVTLCCYGAAFFVICGPIFLPSPLPTEAIYPFSVNSSPVWEIIYIHQAISGFQVSAGMCVDTLVAFLIWYTGIRFELLYNKFTHINSISDMFRCIQEHQYLLRYGKELSETFRYVTLATVLSISAGLAFAGIYLFSPQPIFVKGQFVIVSISAGINLYVTALPSDYLIIKCKNLADVVYETLWMNNPTCISRNWIHIIQRAQKPITIRIPGLINELSLQFYFNVLSSTFSYFTALHVIMTQ